MRSCARQMTRSLFDLIICLGPAQHCSLRAARESLTRLNNKCDNRSTHGPAGAPKNDKAVNPTKYAPKNPYPSEGCPGIVGAKSSRAYTTGRASTTRARERNFRGVRVSGTTAPGNSSTVSGTRARRATHMNRCQSRIPFSAPADPPVGARGTKTKRTAPHNAHHIERSRTDEPLPTARHSVPCAPVNV
ncbi:unnamed protein product [Gemmata massiliana]|uniref:Uncharacterized protein n=1 Tax=Gemmata massiliana TaxID=1210884 RepID=A0A6P2D1G6_9BACT|nr:unnamed protein product [Gemmata massiliana]